MAQSERVVPSRTSYVGRIVERARLYPTRCMITGKGAGPMIDFLKDFNPDHSGRMYLSIAAAKDIGVLVGMHTDEDFTALEDELAAARAELASVTAERDQAIEEIDLVEKLENRGFTTRRRARTGIQRVA